MNQKLSNCLCCSSENLITTFDLGYFPLANSFSSNKIDEKYELKLNLCLDCYHSQLDQSIDRSILFDDYVWVSGTSNKVNEYFKSFVKNIEKEFSTSLNVLDIASNDGSLLKEFKDRGHNVLGVDPAKNLEKISKSNGVDTICNYWPLPKNSKLNKTFDVVIAMNVFGHVNNPGEFLNEIKDYVHENSKIYIQTSQSEMFVNNEFDTIYHEHISFFNTKSFLELLKRTDFVLESVKKVPVHGKSYLWKVSPKKEDFDKDNTVKEMFEFENNIGLYNKDLYENFKYKADSIVFEVKEIIQDFRSRGYFIICCGIAAKGMTFLNYANIEVDLFLDNNQLKQNKFVPGYSKKVHSFETLKTIDQKSLYIIPAWNFKNEITEQIARLRSSELDEILTYYPQVEIKKL